MGELSRHPLAFELGDATLAGDLTLPAAANALVLFAHGSGSSRLSRRNRAVAEALQTRGLATLLFDLLTETEDIDYRRRFDIPLLAARLTAVSDWAASAPLTRALVQGLFGASTGAAAALMTAAARPERIRAVVSRGGRPDLATGQLSQVTAPTLLIVGGADTEVLAWNRSALAALAGPKQLAVVPGASHLFEEAGALEQVMALAGDWLAEYLRTR